MKKSIGIKKIILLIFIFSYFCSATLFSQTNDSVKTLILQSSDSDIFLISKGRNLVVNKITKEFDTKGAKEVFNYLEDSYKNTDYIAFSFFEKWLIYFATSDYKQIIESIQKSGAEIYKISTWNYQGITLYDISSDQSNRKIYPKDEDFYYRMKNYLLKMQFAIPYSIDIAENYTNQEKDFLKLLFHDILYPNEDKSITQDTLNVMAEKYLKAYSTQDSLFKFTKSNILMKYGPCNWGWGMNIGVAFGIPTGEMSEYVRDFWGMDMSFTILYKKFSLMLSGTFTTGNVQQGYTLKGIPLYKDDDINIINMGFLLSYAVLDNNRFKINPFIGTIWSTMSGTKTEERSELENAETPYSFNCALGIQLDFKWYLSSKIWSNHYSYMPIYIKYSYNIPQFNKYNSSLSGGMQFLSVGIGFVFRETKRVF